VRNVRWFRLEYLARTRLWLLPLACVLTGVGLGVALLSIDRASGYELVAPERVAVGVMLVSRFR
jgi:hypothetical protein